MTIFQTIKDSISEYSNAPEPTMSKLELQLFRDIESLNIRKLTNSDENEIASDKSIALKELSLLLSRSINLGRESRNIELLIDILYYKALLFRFKLFHIDLPHSLIRWHSINGTSFQDFIDREFIFSRNILVLFDINTDSLVTDRESMLSCIQNAMSLKIILLQTYSEFIDSKSEYDHIYIRCIKIILDKLTVEQSLLHSMLTSRSELNP